VHGAQPLANLVDGASIRQKIVNITLYLTVVDVPLIHLRMIDSSWAIWLPAGRAPSTSC
jgi:hypothetical protein